MTTLAVEVEKVRAQSLQVDDDSLRLELTDGRTMTVPLVWYPRLWYGTPEERSEFEVLADGAYVHWPRLDEDLSIAGIVAGHRSGEGAASLRKWLAARQDQS